MAQTGELAPPTVHLDEQAPNIHSSGWKRIFIHIFSGTFSGKSCQICAKFAWKLDYLAILTCIWHSAYEMDPSLSPKPYYCRNNCQTLHSSTERMQIHYSE